jgi:hypothetical protein
MCSTYHQILQELSDDEVLSFFGKEAQLVVCSGGACNVVKRSDTAFLKHFRSMKKCPKNIPTSVVDEGASSIFLKWTQKDQSGTDTVIFDNDFNIIRQHTTIFK